MRGHVERRTYGSIGVVFRAAIMSRRAFMAEAVRHLAAHVRFQVVGVTVEMDTLLQRVVPLALEPGVICFAPFLTKEALAVLALRACARARVHECKRASVRACVRASERACVHECRRASKPSSASASAGA